MSDPVSISIETSSPTSAVHSGEVEAEGSVFWHKTLPFYGGIDGGTAVNVYGRAVSHSVLTLLEEARADAVEKGRPVSRTVGDVLCMVGSAPRGEIGYSYALKSGGVSVFIHRNPCERIPAAKITYHWDACDRYDLAGLHATVLGWLKRMGIEREREHLTRLDLQISAGMPIDVFWNATTRGDYRCRQKLNMRIATDEPECITFGTHGSPLMFRCYDKVREAFGNSEQKYLALSDRFDSVGYDVEKRPVTRFEFEAHRKLLRPLGINTFEDLARHGSGYADYLCSWLRFNQEKKKGHSERDVNLREWETVKSMFHEVFDGGIEGLNRPERLRGGDMTLRQAARTESTISTLLAKLLHQRIRLTGRERKELLPELTESVLRDTIQKYRELYGNEAIENPQNLIAHLSGE